MNYTENYHLPQWDEADRIMRKDFNQMCVDLEAGLNGGAQAVDELHQTTQVQERRTLDRFCRAAYNHYLTVKEMDPVPAQIGFFYQDPTKDAANVTGGVSWNGTYFAGSGEERLNTESLRAHITVHSRLKMVKDRPEECTPLEFSLCAPAPGVLTRFSLQGNFSSCVPNAPAPFRLTFIDLDSGKTILTRELDLRQPGVSGVWVNQMVDGPFFFHVGVHYYLKLEPLSAAYDVAPELVLNEYTSIYSTFTNSSVSAVHTFHEPVDSTGGLLILRAAAGGPKGKMTVRWDGKELQPLASWPQTDGMGRPYLHSFYLRGEPIPADSTVSLQFDDGGCGDFLFYDWGAILL